MTNLLEGLNEEQLSAVTHTGGPLLIIAGAGTGKTTVITRRIAWLIEQNLCKTDEVLALTFTDKAATEMQERLDVLLPLGQFDTWISTFHSFCQRILEQNALDIGLPNDFKLLGATQTWMLVYKNFERFSLDYYKPIGNPHKFIDALLQHFSRCKDEVVTPEDYLKYAEELKLNLDNPDFAKASSGKPDFVSVSSRPDSGFDDGVEGSLPRQNFSGQVGSQSLTRDDKDIDITEIKRVTELANAYHTYQQILLEEDALDFGDLVNYTLKLFQERPNILKYYQNKFKYILVDEFQDTNAAQYELVRLLAGQTGVSNETREVSSRLKSHASSLTPNLAVVGDDNQAIYKFRGASVSNILRFKEDFPSAKNITLNTNYRSSQAILDLAYNFIQHNNPNTLEVKLGINKKLINPSKTAGEGKIQVLEGKDLTEEINLVVKNILALKKENPGSSWSDFAILMRSNSASRDILPRLEAAGIPYTYLSNTGLYKKTIIAGIINYLKLLDNYHESSALYKVFNFPKFHLPAEDIASATQFTARKTISLYEALKDQEFLEKIQEESKQKIQTLLGLLNTHSELAKEKTIVEIFVQIIKDLDFGKMLSEETLENAQNRELLEQFYKKIETFEQENNDKTLKGFMEYLSLEEKAGEEGKINFDAENGPESLKVMTVHGSKGLEFENVFLVGMVDQRFPTRAKKDAIELPERLIKDILPDGDFHLQEERRLFYVACTRAKKNLFFSWSSDYGGARGKKPSIFLVEAGLLPSDKISKATGKVVLQPQTTHPKKQIYKILPTSFSYSAIKSFLQCPLEYKYNYYLKLPQAGSPYFSFGQTIHKVFEKYLLEYKKRLDKPAIDLFGERTKENLLPDFNYLEKLYEEHWVDEWYLNKKQKAEYREKGEELLKVFYEKTTSAPPKVKYIEKFFKLKMAEFEFVGKIDRADETPEGLKIIDYKTGKPPKTKSDEDTDQLRIYQLAARDFLKEKTHSMAYWYLEGDAWKEVETATPDEMLHLEEHLLDTMKKITEAVKFDLFAEIHYNSKQHICNFEGWE